MNAAYFQYKHENISASSQFEVNASASAGWEFCELCNKQ